MAGINFRKVGVNGINLPPKRTLTVQPSDFQIGGILAETERRYNKAFGLKSPEEYNQIFGGQINANDYGPDAIKGFFDNVVGVDATLYVQSLIGYDIGSDVIDAIVASRNKADVGADADAYTVEAAYQEELEYGSGGNRTGSKFTQADRFATQAAGTVAATGVSVASLDSVIGIRIGDIILFKTAAGVSPVYKKIVNVDESANTVSWSGDFEVSPASGETLSIDDEVVIPGFKIQTYRKSISGIETEVEAELGKIVCSSEPEVVDFYVENIHSSNKWIKITEASASTLGDRLPANDSVIVYPTNGANGTTVTSVEAQAFFLSNFNELPIRFLANPETTNEAMQKALETYSLTRDDSPISIFNIAQNRTKSQLIIIGNSFQRSNEVTGIISANWLRVTDPFTNSTIAPLRIVPNVGHIMGLWIRTIGVLGVHFIPSTNATPILGVLGVESNQIFNDDDRTDLIGAGINLIQEIKGIGIKLQNCVTPSTDNAYVFGNGILMRNFIKVSSVDSLSSSENTPNSLNRITSDKMAILTFLYNLWDHGSTGDVVTGETFGQTFDEDGNPTTAEDSFQVIADSTNNPQSSIELGNRNLDTYFTYPAPAQSIEIGVGILLRG